MVMQRTLTGNAEPPQQWPPKQVQSAHKEGVYEITWTQRTSIIVTADNRDEARNAARSYDPDFYYGDTEIDVYKLSHGDTPDYRVQQGKIIHDDDHCAPVEEITPEMIADELQRRAEVDYAHLTDFHAEQCALRDLEEEIGAGEWPRD